jgi:hypothetical protein
MHVKIVGTTNLTPLRPKAGQPTGATSKPPVAQENKKPEPVSAQIAVAAKASEQPKSPKGDAPSAISLVLQQAGQEAAKKAKDSKRKAPETLSGVGQAEPAKKQAEKATIPAPIAVEDLSIDKLTIHDPTSLQSPGSTAWRKAPDSIPSIDLPASPPPTMNKFSLQSPNSTAWKPTDFNPPILEHRGSSISVASAEEIKQVEDACAIPEEDEDEEETTDEEGEGDTKQNSKPEVAKGVKPALEEESDSEEGDSDEEDDEEDER